MDRTTVLHDLIVRLPETDRETILRTLVSDDFPVRFQILLGLEDEGPRILHDLFGSELLRLPGEHRKDDSIDTLLLGFLQDEQLEGRRRTPLTPTELGVINAALALALFTEKNLVISEQAVAALRVLADLTKVPESPEWVVDVQVVDHFSNVSG